MRVFKKYLHWAILSISVIAFAILAANILPTHAAGNENTYTGWLTILWGDSQNGESTAPQYTLHNTENGDIQLLIDLNANISPGLLLELNNQQVNVQGNASLSAQGAVTTLEITSIAPVGIAANDLQAKAVTGSQPFVSILCKFSDYTAYEPEDLTYFKNMYASTYPGLNHYWQEVSYGTANINGSNAYGWFTLPNPRSYYVYSGKLDTHRAAVDCTGAAEPYINFTGIKGINLMFNADLDGYAWGGTDYLTLDGISKLWSITWEPPWGYEDITVISHEMGHAFGLPHSSGNYGQTYDNEWDVMSNSWANCGNSYNATYGCLGQHTISYHKDSLGWIPANQKYTVNDKSYASVTLEQLALPQTSNYKMVQVPINGSTSHFYTVEVRRKTGYDVKLPGEAVIIHEVDLYRSRPAYVIDSDGNGDTGDAGAMWTVGETFTDVLNNIQISVIAATTTGFQVTIANDATAPPANFRVTGSGQYSISLAWNDSAGETGYKLYRKIDGTFVVIANITANTTTYTDQDVSCNATYEYKLSSYTANGESSPTNALAGGTSSICPDPPPNDNFANRIGITLPSSTSPSDTREATQEQNDPDLAGCNISGSGKATVWYTYQANSNTAISLDTLSANYDTFIAVWTGTYPNLSLVACNNNTSGTEQSQLAFQVSNGTTYYIEVGQP